MTYRYILIDGVPVEEPDLFRWAKWYEEGDNRQIALTDLRGGLFVSTVFLGIAFPCFDDEPLLFETAIFQGGHPLSFDRYKSLDEARRGHDHMVRYARDTFKRNALVAKRRLYKVVKPRPASSKNEMDLLVLDS